MKPEMGLWIEAFLSVILSLPKRALDLLSTEGSVDASSQYIVNSMTYLVGYFPFCKYLLSPNYLFSQRMKVKERPKTEQDRKWHGYGAKK